MCFIYVDDITRIDYNFSSSNVSLLHYYWNLSRKAEYMMDSHFITGFQVIIVQLGNDSNTQVLTTTNKSLTLNVSLIPNQWYLLNGRILSEDNDTWAPEAIYKHFKTPGKIDSTVIF